MSSSINKHYALLDATLHCILLYMEARVRVKIRMWYVYSWLVR